jgi:hypothetical protein
MNKAAFPLTNVQFFQENMAKSQFREIVDDHPDPVSHLAYPVFDSFNFDDREVVGIITANIYWGVFFKNILPESARGYLCVVENSFNQTLTYRIDGPDAVFLGQEVDRHDTRYDYLEQFTDINQFVQEHASPQTRSYTTVPLNRKHGNYRLRIYPSYETEQEFTTNERWVYAFIVTIVVLVTTTVLVVLDRIVAKRQRFVMQRLVKAAEDTAAFEHELNAFLAHEVRK